MNGIVNKELKPRSILYLDGVSVSFDGFKALNSLSFVVEPGELRAIIGPNGAGKTTMMDIITGKTRPDEGTVFFGSTIDLLRHKEAEIAQLGIGRKFQKPTVFEHLTVFENLELALKTDKGVKASMLFRLDSAQCDRLAEVLHTIHLEGSVLRLAGNLSHASLVPYNLAGVRRTLLRRRGAARLRHQRQPDIHRGHQRAEGRRLCGQAGLQLTDAVQRRHGSAVRLGICRCAADRQPNHAARLARARAHRNLSGGPEGGRGED